MAATTFSNLVFFYATVRLLVDGMEEFLIQPTAWYYVEYLEQSNLYLGFLLAAFSFAALISAPWLGALDVRFKAPKLILLVGGLMKFVGNLLYTIPTNTYFPMIGRFMSGVGEGSVGVLYGAIAQATNKNNRAQAFLYFEGLATVGISFGPMIGSLLTFEVNILSWKINEGNSPGLILFIIWFFLLILTILLPRDLAKNKSTSVKSIVESSSSEDEMIVPMEDMIEKYSYSRICCLNFVIFQSWLILNVGMFYTPLIAAQQLGLGLTEIKLIYVNCALFSFVLFIASYVFTSHFSEKKFIGIGIVSHTVPLVLLFYFALSWDDFDRTNNAYLLMVFAYFLVVSFVMFPLSCSLLSKETPPSKASLYQSIAFSVMHLPIVISGITAGATLNRTGMTCVAFGLTIGTIVELAWFLREYRHMFPASERKH